METFITVLGVILFLVFFVSFVAMYVFLKRALSTVEQQQVAITLLEEENASALNSNNQYDAWFEEFKAQVITAYQRIKTIDASGHFEADDEVGFFFTELKSIIERLYVLGIIDDIEKQEALDTIKAKNTTEEIQKILAQKRSASISSIREEK